LVSSNKHVYKFSVLTRGTANNNFDVLGYWCEPASCTAAKPDWETSRTEAYWTLVK
jgi:hypothetical protein